MMRSKIRQVLEHVYMLAVCAFLLWDVAYMTEAAWTFDAPEVFPWITLPLAAAGIILCRGKLGAGWFTAGFLGWTLLVSARMGERVLAAQWPALCNGVLAFLVLLPAAKAVEGSRLQRWLRALLAAWTACFTLQAAVGLWAALTGHAVFSLRGTWYIGVNLGDNRLYLNAYVTTAAVKMGLSVLLAVLGAAVAKRRAGRIAYGLCAMVQLACLSLTDCRTAFIAVGAGFGLGALAMIVRGAKGERRSRGLLRWGCGLAAAAVLTAGTYTGLTGVQKAIAPHVQRELENILFTELPGELLPAAGAETADAVQSGVQHRALEKENFFNGRQHIWAAALRLLRYEPRLLLTGTTAAMAAPMANLYLDVSVARPYVHVHNIYLHVLVSWGIPGFVMMAAAVICFLLAARRVLLVHDLPLWQRMTPVPVLYVLLCETVDCFTLLSARSPMLLFACFFAGVTMALDAREVKRA